MLWWLILIIAAALLAESAKARGQRPGWLDVFIPVAVLAMLVTVIVEWIG